MKGFLTAWCVFVMLAPSLATGSHIYSSKAERSLEQLIGASGTIVVQVTQGGTGLTATTANQLLYSSSNNVIAGLATANNGVLITSGGGVPSISATLPSGLTLPSPIITNIAPGANFTLTQNSVAALTSEATGATVNTLYLKAGSIGMGTTAPASAALAGSTKVLDLTHNAQLSITLHDTATAQESNLTTDGAGFYIDNSGHATATNNKIVLRVGATNGSYTVTEVMRLTSAGNMGIRTSTFGTSAAGVVALKQGTCGTTSPADQIELCAVDINGAGTTGLKIRDELGDVYIVGNSNIVSPGKIRTACSTVSALPTGVAGDRYCVNDQLTTCPALSGTFTGGGAVTCSAFYNGTAWVHE